MAIAPPPSLNGRQPRKQLSDQLDRMDEMINGLEEFLPVAVADAARDGIRQAFRDVLGELVADPAMLDKLRAGLGAEATPIPAKPSAWARLKAVIRSAAAKVVRVVGTVRRKITTGIRTTCVAAKTRVARWSLVSLPVKSVLGASLAVGLVVTFVSLSAPHVFAAIVSGVAAAITTAFVQVGRWLRRQRTMLGLV